jgi:DNA-binding response OmpR family regulator
MCTIPEVRKKIQTLADNFVSEVLREIDGIETSGTAATACAVNEPELFFDEQNRTVRWNGGAVKLCRKQFAFIQALWNGTKHSEQLDVLEEYVWQDRHTKKQPFVRRHAIFALVSRTRKNVSNVNFPYKIESIKNFSTLELQGYQLVLSAPHEISLQAE